jgi:hypothetical protein
MQAKPVLRKVTAFKGAPRAGELRQCLESKKSFRVSDDSSGTVFVVPGVFSKATVSHFDERRGVLIAEPSC